MKYLSKIKNIYNNGWKSYDWFEKITFLMVFLFVILIVISGRNEPVREFIKHYKFYFFMLVIIYFSLLIQRANAAKEKILEQKNIIELKEKETQKQKTIVEEKNRKYLIA